MQKKFTKLSPSLKKYIVEEEGRAHGTGPITELVKGSKTPISTFGELTLKHCNGGSTMQAALWLKDHLKNGGKVGVTLAELIRKGKVHLVSATAANHEESYYRYVAHSHYAYIPRYTELTPEQEA